MEDGKTGWGFNANALGMSIDYIWELLLITSER
jgi:hypothetical protein